MNKDIITVFSKAFEMLSAFNKVNKTAKIIRLLSVGSLLAVFMVNLLTVLKK